jgi:hydroxyacylglutathione hydrolase
MVMRIEKIVVGQLGVNCYIIIDEFTTDAIVVDPGDEFERIAEVIDEKQVTPRYILFTHAHYDHVCAAGELKARYQASLVMHEDEKATYEFTKKLCLSWGYDPKDFPRPDRTVRDKDKITTGKVFFEVIHSPGHTPGSLCIYGEKTLFTGDTLFKGSVGRTDLPGGDTEKLLSSLNKIVLLPPETRIFCGHGDETTLAWESKKNLFLLGRSQTGFLR